ncbi:MAG: GH25 family lysozyme [Clostridia bacterium]
MPNITEQETITIETQSTAPTTITAVKPQKNYTFLIVLIVLFSLIAAISSSGTAYFYWKSTQPVEVEILEEPILESEEIKEVEIISFGDYSLPVNYALPVNSYDQELFATEDNGLISYGDARLGIEVSQHQKEIDWQAVADEGVSFAMIRLGYRGYGEEGLIRLDEYFHYNMEEAKAAGIDVGVYFFSQATSVWETLEESYFVLENLEGYELDLPVVFNWEFIDNNSLARTNTMQGQCITLYNQVFNEKMQKAGYDTMTYFNQSLAYLYLDLDLLQDNPFWLASYRSSPVFYYDFQIWQYTDKGTIDGIEGYVDLNLMLTDFTEEEIIEEVTEELPVEDLEETPVIIE